MKDSISGRGRVLIIYTPSAGSRKGVRGISFPLGAAYIAAVLRKKYTVNIHDFNFDYCLDRLDEAGSIRGVLNKYKYDFLLISGVFPKYRIIREIIQASREISRAKIIVGGSFTRPLIDARIRYLGADYYVLGEGEPVIVELLDCLGSGVSVEHIKGIAWPEGEGFRVTGEASSVSDLDAIPFPDRSLLNFHYYKRYFARGFPLAYSAQIIASRGCPFRCVFCNPSSGRVVRARSPENIYDEIMMLQKDYGCRYFIFYDEVLLGGFKQNITAFCEYVLSKGKPAFRWGGSTNHQLIDKETLSLMKKAGCIKISFGVESGSRAVLKEMRKRHDLEKLKSIAAHCYKLGIEASFSLLTNMFSETKETLSETREYLKYFRKFYFRDPPVMNFIVPVPGTELYKKAREKGMISTDELGTLFALDESSRYKLRWNLTGMDTGEFLNTVHRINRELELEYYRRHPFQFLISRYTAFDHFNLKATLGLLSSRGGRPLAEGLLWAFCRGKTGERFYRKVIYK